MSFDLFVEPNVVMRNKDNGKGWEVCLASHGHRANLKIGNVSVAFDDWNNDTEDNGNRPYLSLGEYGACPVRFNGNDVSSFVDPAEQLLHALAADLGYFIEKVEG